MIHEWIRNHKKLAILLCAVILAVLGVLITLLVNYTQNRDVHEETEMTAAIQVSNIDVLYDNFSDYEIGYIFNALNKALIKDQSMKNGSPVSENKIPAANTTDDQLYPSVSEGNYNLTIKDGSVTDFEDNWGMWKRFTVTTQDNRSYRVEVAIGAHSRENDVGYTPMTITKL